MSRNSVGCQLNTRTRICMWDTPSLHIHTKVEINDFRKNYFSQGKKGISNKFKCNNKLKFISLDTRSLTLHWKRHFQQLAEAKTMPKGYSKHSSQCHGSCILPTHPHMNHPKMHSKHKIPFLGILTRRRNGRLPGTSLQTFTDSDLSINLDHTLKCQSIHLNIKVK